MDLLSFLKRAPDLAEAGCATKFARLWDIKSVRKGTAIIQQGARQSREIILLDGCLTSTICSAEGQAVCVGLNVGTSVVAPSIARLRDGVSLVTIEALSDVLIAQIDAQTLLQQMVASVPLRTWANGILREELARKADREWCLAALGGAERLAWFRSRFPGYEDIFNHTLIASYLGMTPVTLSRLRAKAP